MENMLSSGETKGLYSLERSGGKESAEWMEKEQNQKQLEN